MSMIILIPENVYNELMTGELPEAVSDVFCKKAVEIIDVADKYARYAIENIEEDLAEEKREQELAHRPAELHAEGHAFVLHEAQAEPVAQHIYLLAESHVGLDQIFDYLVNDHQHYSERHQPGASGHFHFRPDFASFSLASTVSVA